MRLSLGYDQLALRGDVEACDLAAHALGHELELLDDRFRPGGSVSNDEELLEDLLGRED